MSKKCSSKKKYIRLPKEKIISVSRQEIDGVTKVAQVSQVNETIFKVIITTSEGIENIYLIDTSNNILFFNGEQFANINVVRQEKSNSKTKSMIYHNDKKLSSRSFFTKFGAYAPRLLTTILEVYFVSQLVYDFLNSSGFWTFMLTYEFNLGPRIFTRFYKQILLIEPVYYDVKSKLKLFGLDLAQEFGEKGILKVLKNSITGFSCWVTTGNNSLVKNGRVDLMEVRRRRSLYNQINPL